MKKDYNIHKYKNTVLENNNFFKKYYYHSLIDSNFVKLDSILNFGIMSKRFIEQSNLINLYTHDKDSYDCKNGFEYISLSEFSDDTEFVSLFESFALHTLTSISLLVDKKIAVVKKDNIETFFDDEVFCKDIITKNHIKGIILPEHLTNKRISEISCLPNSLECYTYKYINHWIDSMEKYFQKKISKDLILTYLKYFKEILLKYECPERWIATILETEKEKYGYDLKDVLAKTLEELWEYKTGITNPTCIEIIDYLNKNKLNVYEIKTKELKRII